MYYMTDEIISLRIGKDVREEMRRHTHINWSAVLRKLLIEEIKKIHSMRKKKLIEASKRIDQIRESEVFNSERTGAEIIREWRDKKR